MVHFNQSNSMHLNKEVGFKMPPVRQNMLIYFQHSARASHLCTLLAKEGPRAIKRESVWLDLWPLWVNSNFKNARSLSGTKKRIETMRSLYKNNKWNDAKL